MPTTLLFPIIGAVISVGGIFIAIGMYKSKMQHSAEVQKAHAEEMKTFASKEDLQAAAARGNENLAAAFKRSDEMLEIMRKRAEEDRLTGAGQFRDFYGLLTTHAERIKALEIQQSSLMESVKELKADVKEGFKKLEEKLEENMKELRKHV